MSQTQRRIRSVTGQSRQGNAGGRRSRYQTRRDAYNYYRRRSTGGMGG